MPSASTVAACLLAAVAIGGCTSNAHPSLDANRSSSTPGHGSLTASEFKVAVAVARAKVQKYSATITSATATIGPGTVTDPNAGPPCTSGTLLHIKLIGTFPTIVTTGNGGQPTPTSETVTAALITADPQSGKACLIGVQVGPTAPDPGATMLFSK